MNEKLQSSLNLLIKSSVIVFLGIILSKVLTYAHRVLIARYFGVDVYGVYSLALVCAGWFIAFASLGLSEGCLRYFAVYRGQKDIESSRYLMQYSQTLLGLSGIFAGLVLLALSKTIGTDLFSSPDLTIFLRWFSFSIPLTVIALPYVMAIRAYEKITAYTLIYSVLQNTVKFFLLIVFILAGIAYSPSIIGSYLISISAVLFISYLYISRKLPELLVKSKLSTTRKSILKSTLMEYSNPMMFYSILVSIFYWIDSISLGFYKTTYEVGLYNAAVPIALLMGIVPELFNQLFFPMIARYQSTNKKGLAQELTKQVTKWILLISLPLFIIIVLYPTMVISFFFGSEFGAAAPALRILALGGLISAMGAIPATLVSASGRSNKVLLNILIATIINFFLNTLFVPAHTIFGIDNSNGLVGASVATLIAIFVMNGLFLFQASKIVGTLPFRWKMINILLSAILVIGTFLIPAIFFEGLLQYTVTGIDFLQMALLFILLIIMYIIFLMRLESFDRYDLEIVEKIKMKFIKSLSSKDF